MRKELTAKGKATRKRIIEGALLAVAHHEADQVRSGGQAPCGAG
ncbi:hypothetical protein [Streptomyces sp. Inha503]